MSGKKNRSSIKNQLYREDKKYKKDEAHKKDQPNYIMTFITIGVLAGAAVHLFVSQIDFATAMLLGGSIGGILGLIVQKHYDKQYVK